MNWEEKIVQFFTDANGEFTSRWTSCLACDGLTYNSSDYGVNECITAIEQGNLEEVKNTLQKRANALENIKQYMRLVKGYVRAGGKVNAKHHNGFTKGDLKKFQETGVLSMVTSDNVSFENAVRINNLRILQVSRILRDAEKRCLKHPRHKKV